VVVIPHNDVFQSRHWVSPLTGKGLSAKKTAIAEFSHSEWNIIRKTQALYVLFIEKTGPAHQTSLAD
jgi:hypothetical protein